MKLLAELSRTGSPERGSGAPVCLPHRLVLRVIAEQPDWDVITP